MGYNLAKKEMKKALLTIVVLVLAIISNANNYQMYQPNNKTIVVEYGSETVFRGTQRLRCNDNGWEIYMYSNGDFKMFDEDGKFVAQGTYSYNSSASEVYVYETDGSLAYKCYCSVNPKTQQVNYLVLAGNKYYRKS